VTSEIANVSVVRAAFPPCPFCLPLCFLLIAYGRLRARKYSESVCVNSRAIFDNKDREVQVERGIPLRNNVAQKSRNQTKTDLEEELGSFCSLDVHSLVHEGRILNVSQSRGLRNIDISRATMKD